jgi:tripartite-type tricarboxylate transporter receptor subunit TctC
MKPYAGFLSLGCLLGAAAFLAPMQAQADAVEDFYKGKVVRVVDGYPAGGGYGAYASLIARHLGKHIPGHPTVIYQNMPGAGSLTLTNHMFNRAEKDGTIIGAPSNSAAFSPLLGNPESRFEADKFFWLPSPVTETGLLVVWHASGVKTIQQAQEKELFAGISSQNGTSGFYGRILNDILHTKLKLLVGYPQMNETLLAMEKGEVHAFPSAFWGSLKANKADWLAEKKLNLLVQYGLKPNPELRDVPIARDLVKNEDDRQVLDNAMASLQIARPYMMPPGTPLDRVAAMRKAFLATFADPDFKAEAKKANLDLDADPKTGEDVAKIIADAYKSPQRVVDRLRKLYEVEAAK